MDDPRTTDEAWIETIAVHFHATNEIGDDLILQTSDHTEVRHVAWYVVDDIDTMYASHKAWLQIVVERMNKETNKRLSAKGQYGSEPDLQSASI